MPFVNSDAISRIEHDKATGRMHITFRESNKTYIYLGVSNQVYVSLITATSIGAYFNEKIKDHYPFLRE